MTRSSCGRRKEGRGPTTSHPASYQERQRQECGVRIRGKQRQQTRDEVRDTKQHRVVRPRAGTPQPGSGRERHRQACHQKEGGACGPKLRQRVGGRGRGHCQQAPTGSKSRLLMSAILQESCLNVGNISHGGSIYTMETNKWYKSGLLFPPPRETAETRAHETRLLAFIPLCGFVPWRPRL